jgi:hypothetical protein
MYLKAREQYGYYDVPPVQNDRWGDRYTISPYVFTPEE